MRHDDAGCDCSQPMEPTKSHDFPMLSASLLLRHCLVDSIPSAGHQTGSHDVFEQAAVFGVHDEFRPVLNGAEFLFQLAKPRARWDVTFLSRLPPLVATTQASHQSRFPIIIARRTNAT